MKSNSRPSNVEREPRASEPSSDAKTRVAARRTIERRLAEALEQQAATNEILRVLGRSRTDAQPVFDLIAQWAGKLCDAEVSVVSRFDGKMIELGAIHGVVPEGVNILRTLYPMRVDAPTVTARTIRGCVVVHVPDVLADPGYGIKDFALAARYRSGLGVPIVRDHQVVGSIFVGRMEPGRFADSQVELLKTFSEQAAIAIENARLFAELEARTSQLRQSDERYALATSAAVEGIYEWDVEAGTLFLTERAKVFFALEGAELTPAAWNVRVHPEDYPGYKAAIANHFNGRAPILEHEYRIADANGGYKWVLDRGIGVRDANGRVKKVVGALSDVTQRKRAEIENVRLFKELEARSTELTRSVGELKALGEVGRAVSSTLDLETVLNTIVSRAAELAGTDGGSIWEYDEAREEFDLRATDRLPPELIEALRATPIRKGEGGLGRLAVTGEPVQIGDIVDEGVYQSRVRESLIRLGYRSLLAVPLLREDHLLGGLAVNRKSAGEFTPAVIDLLKNFATQSALAIHNARLFREIKEKGRELETASRHKSEFLANMSHELRTPLNAIIGFSEVLSERMFGEINEKQAEYLGDILDSGKHLLSLINDILDLSKIEAGRMELSSADFDLRSAIGNTLSLVKERAHRRGITLEPALDDGLGTILADERKVKQVLLNLLSNALKFTPEGGRIVVRARAHDGVAEISVADTGVGIAPEDQDALFEEFRQVGTTSKKVEGTGLGLAISRKFIELHGGRIWVQSESGVGSTFTFTLPLQ